MIYLEHLGNLIVDVILGVSDLLREDYTPGLVSVVLLSALLGALLHLWLKTRRRCIALKGLQDIVESVDGAEEFSDNLSTINRDVNEFATDGPASPRGLVASAWGEYSETLVQRREGDQTVLRNSVRPSQFFNPEDLRFGVGFWRVLPGLFVTIGLFLTFLGLVSALHAMDTGSGVSEEAMTELLSIASAKFIMSLTGLLCSIVFTALLRSNTGKVEQATHSLNLALEDRLSFLSLEELGVKQIEAMDEQKEHFRTIGMELVEELGRPLREELPKTISDSIGNAMSPLIRQVSELGTSSMGDMVKDLSSQLATDVEVSLQKAGTQLERAGEQLSTVVNRMDGSASRIGTEMESANHRMVVLLEDLQTKLSESASNTSTAFSEGVESILTAMRTTLDGIRSNTAEGASAMANAAVEMRRSAEQFRDELSNATEKSVTAAQERMNLSGESASRSIRGVGDQVSSALENTGRTLASFAGEVVEKAGRDLLGPIETIAKQLNEISNALSNGAIEMRRASDGVKDGADATQVASTNFRGAAQTLVAAGEEVKPSVVRLENATHNLATSTRQVGESTQRNTESVSRVLEAAQTALGSERQAVESTLENLERLLEAMRGQGDRIDDIDEKLGRAFEEYRKHVAAEVDALRNHVNEMKDNLTPPLDRLREIVESIEPYIPEQQNNRRVG